MLENIQKLCKQKGIKLSNVEKELGFGRGSIYKWSKNSPSIDKVQKVADYFRVSVDLVLYGFELTRFEELFRIIMNRRTCEQFAKDTGVDLEVVEDYAFGITTEQPSLDLVKKLADSNPYKVIVDDESLYQAAGYTKEEAAEASMNDVNDIDTIAAHHDGDAWTNEELEDIERFKAFIKSKRR